MSDSPTAERKAAERRRRGAALRENLRRRKLQTKARQAAERPRSPHDSAEIDGEKTPAQ